MKRTLVLAAAFQLPGLAHADDLSGADKLRTIYSAEFRFTREGLPVVPIAVAEGLREVTISAEGGLRVLPEGEGGPEIRADASWHVRLVDGTPARIRHWTVVWRGRPSDAAEAAEMVKTWKSRGVGARTFEHGTLFAVAGEVLDRREVLVAVGPAKSYDDADRAIEALGKKGPVFAPGVYLELADRPHGQVEANGSKTGISLKNEGVIWFAPAGDAPIHVGDRSFFGRIYVTLDRHGTMAVVNAVPEDRLLAGLVPAEIYPAAHEEALKAQAVAARGALLAKIGTRHLADPYRLCSTTHCQVYAGAGKEVARVTAAVNSTRGQVLFGPGGKDLADTVYSANCGGHTESNEHAWPEMKPDPLLRGHADVPAGKTTALADGVTPEALTAFLERPPDAWCRRSTLGGADRFRWTVTLSKADLDRLLGASFGALRAIEVTLRGVSGRAREIRIVGDKKTEVVRGELRIRQLFGGLRSTLFLVDVKDGAATFRGGGFGHGVGLCQTGAMGMAEGGKTHKDILKHYYPGSVLRKLW